MKEKLIFAVGAMSIAAAVAVVCLNDRTSRKYLLFYENVAALSDNETGVEGQCEEDNGECIAVCQNCHAKYYAGGHKGGSYNMSGKCVVCKEENW